MLYGSMGWLRGQFGDALDGLTWLRLWAAGGPEYSTHGSDVPDMSGYNVAPWNHWTIFQYREFGTVPGAGTGSVDTDQWNGEVAT